MKQANKVKQTRQRNTAHQRQSLFTVPNKNELHVSRVKLEPTTLYTLDRALYQLHVHVYMHELHVPW